MATTTTRTMTVYGSPDDTVARLIRKALREARRGDDEHPPMRNPRSIDRRTPITRDGMRSLRVTIEGELL